MILKKKKLKSKRAFSSLLIVEKIKIEPVFFPKLKFDRHDAQVQYYLLTGLLTTKGVLYTFAGAPRTGFENINKGCRLKMDGHASTKNKILRIPAVFYLYSKI